MPLLSQKKILPYLALAVGVLALGISPLFAKWSDASGPVFSVYRMLAAAVVLLPFFIRSQKQTPTRITGWLLIFPILGGLANALDLSVFFTAIRYTRVASATLLNNTAPIWVALVAWLFFKEKLKGTFWVGLFVALIGAAVVLGSDFILHPDLNIGNLLALLSSLFYASYYLATQQGRRRLNAIQYTYLMTLSSGAFNLLFTILFQLPLTGFNLRTYLASVGSGVVTQSMGFLALSYALGHLSASTVSPTMLFQPVLTALLAIPLFGELLQPGQWIGGLATLGGIFMVNRSLDTSREPAQPAAEAVLEENFSPDGGSP